MWPAWTTSSEMVAAQRFWIIAALILMLGATLRIVGLFDDFWLDEIWSWDFAMTSKSPTQILFGIHHDNNHHLNTLWMYLWGNQPHWLVYRLHSYVAGVLTIVGSGLLAGDVNFTCRLLRRSSRRTTDRRRSAESSNSSNDDCAAFARNSALLTMFLSATCEYACVYSTEARGYAMSGAAAVFSTVVLRRLVMASTERRSQASSALIYAMLALFGFFSHLTFAAVFLPQFVWSSVCLAMRRRFLTIAICYLPVFFGVATLWLLDLKYAKTGGAPLTSSFTVALESLVLPMGISQPDWLVLLCSGIMLAGLIAGLYFLARGSLTEATLFGLMLIFAPPLMYGLRSDGLLSPRHFFVIWMVLFPLLGLPLTLLCRSSGRLQLLGLALLVFWLATNGWEFIQFATYGRGGYERSVTWLAQEAMKESGSSSKLQSIGSDHDFRNSMVLSFYMRRQSLRDHFQYFPQGRWPVNGVDWLFVHSLERDSLPQSELQVGSWQYERKHLERFSAPIGWHWAIYQKRTSTKGTSEKSFNP